jgi:hypothetical protein
MSMRQALVRASSAIVLCAVGSGCSLVAALVESDVPGPDAGTRVDADLRPDADPVCATWAFAPAHVDPCAIPAPTGGLVLGAGAWTFDTNTGVLVDPQAAATSPTSALVTPVDGPEARVLSVDALVVAAGATLQVSGTRPLIILAWSTASIDGRVSVASNGGGPGAGADPVGCTAVAAQPGGADPEGAGGGGGGGFGDAGASGGTGDNALTTGGRGGAAAPSPIALRGGCAGAAGGNAQAGAGGAGGGAIDLVARDQLTIAGVIQAGGAGGGPGLGGRGGGGGGGAGGLIELESQAIRLGGAAVLTANGGGGGGGCDGTPASPGQDGRASAIVASGGAGQGMGAAGGAGAALGSAAVAGIGARRGGGGGGGGVGVVQIVGATDLAATAVISPAPR